MRDPTFPLLTPTSQQHEGPEVSPLTFECTLSLQLLVNAILYLILLLMSDSSAPVADLEFTSFCT